MGQTLCTRAFAGDTVTKAGSAHELTVFELRPSRFKYLSIEFAEIQKES